MVCGVVLMKGRSRWMRVSRPPPPPLEMSLSCLSVVYPGIPASFLVGLSLDSWIVAMWMLCSCRTCLSSCILFPKPSMFNCSILMDLNVF